MNTDGKRCTKCGVTQPVGEFVRDPQKRDGLYSSCKTCYRTKYKYQKRVYQPPVEPRACLICDRVFTPRRTSVKRGKGTFCSQKCKGVSHRGPAHPSWKRATSHHSGYVMIHDGDEGPRSREHRIVMEKRIGRALTSADRVHHINCVKTDNSPSNLFLCNTSTHQIAHLSLNRLIPGLMADGVVGFDHKAGHYYRIGK